jgi:hypothetical protein
LSRPVLLLERRCLAVMARDGGGKPVSTPAKEPLPKDAPLPPPPSARPTEDDDEDKPVAVVKGRARWDRFFGRCASG